MGKLKKLCVYTVLFSSLTAMGADGLVFDLSFLSPFRGSFGGDMVCPTPTLRRPVILIHGNADSSRGWISSSGIEKSFVDQLKTLGYTNCEIYAISYLSITEQATPARNFHSLKKSSLIANYIQHVIEKTGPTKIDIVAHSLGVTLGLEAAAQKNLFPSIQNFVAIAGALKGLESCQQFNPETSDILTCRSVLDKKGLEFGFWPDQPDGIKNPRLGLGAQGFSNFANLYPMTKFFSISAGLSDEVLCGTNPAQDSNCSATALFSSCEPNSNCQKPIQVIVNDLSQKTVLDVAAQFTGIKSADIFGHMKVRALAAPIVDQMINGSCADEKCCVNLDKNFSCEKKEK